MGKKKGGKKKTGLPEGTPLEDYETAEMKLKDLQKYAAKLGAVLSEVRTERSNMEIDRDKMLRNLVNVVCRRMMIDREIRGLDRELINKENIFERKMSDKVNELAELRFKQIPQHYRSKNDIFVSTYEAQRQLFLKQDQMFKDRLALNSDYFKKYLELEGTFMASKHISLCDKIDKVNESNISKLLWSERIYYQRQKQLDKIQYEQCADDMKFIVDRKENIIENIQKEHVLESVDILRSFEEITKYNFTVINELSENLSNVKYSDLKVRREYKDLTEKYDLYCSFVKEAEHELTTIQPVITYIHHTKAAETVYTKKLQETDEEATNARLEVELLEEYMRKDDEATDKLKEIIIRDLMSFRQLQVKAHLYMMNLGKKVKEMYEDRVLIGKLALCPIELNLKPFQDMYKRYNCYRLSMIDIVERLLRCTASNLYSLGFQPEKEPALPKLPPKSRSTESQFSKEKRICNLETGIPSILKTPPKRPSTSKLYGLITSLPRVGTRTTADHLLPYMQCLHTYRRLAEVGMWTLREPRRILYKTG